ncbi:GrdX family protein [Senegalia sp. (in: firmicutes)]|uniref:GrdX family protein n=1 Tax=Senegalia sp. (in: firmicutes) TaxID=1924098 RepID=UPI003F9EA408
MVTNNPKVKEEFKNMEFIEGSFLDVLIRVRDLVYRGHELITHPLGASIRMIYSPYRSIIIGRKNDIDSFHIETIENSILNYKKNMEVRKPDNKNKNDYALIDSELLKSGLEEHLENEKICI